MKRTMRAAVIVLALILSVPAFAASVPMPRTRPHIDDVPRIAQVYDLSPEPSDCQIRLAEKAEIERRPTLVGPGECGGYDMVLVKAVRMADGSRVTINPPADLRCKMAHALADFVREPVASAFAPARLKAVENYNSYECRGRNRVVGAKISEHGKGTAIDIRAFRLATDQVVELTDYKVARDLRDGLKRAACVRFSTVLGPGSDGHHEGHIHLDVVERRGGFKMCQWEVRDLPAVLAKADVPLPPSRPLPQPAP